MNTSINFAGIKMKNPVTVSSGTCGYGRELSEFFNLSELGAIITKGTATTPWTGNPPPRICETPSGLLNSIGLQNPGVEYFLKYDLPWLRKQGTAIIVNAIGHSIEEYVEVCKVLNDSDIDGVELNLSCPNVERGCAFGIDYDGVKAATTEVRKVLKNKPLIVKLTPNVTDITLTARAAEDAGADAISLINTILAMAINIETKRPISGVNTAGLSGPAVRPIAVRMVYEVAHAVKIPILGMGGIVNGKDAVEFMMAGAAAVSIGSGTLRDPYTSVNTVKEIEEFMKTHNIDDVNTLIGSVIMN